MTPRTTKAPPTRDSWQSALEEAAEFGNATPEQHYQALAEACRLAFAILAQRPDREALLAYQDPLPPESISLLARLRRGR